MAFAKLKEKWQGMDAGVRSRTVRLIAVACVVGLLFMVAKLRETSVKERQERDDQGNYGPLQERIDKYNDTVYRSTNKKLGALEKQLESNAKGAEAIGRKTADLMVENKQLRDQIKDLAKITESTRKALEQQGIKFDEKFDDLMGSILAGEPRAGEKEDPGPGKSAFPPPPGGRNANAQDRRIMNWEIPIQEEQGPVETKLYKRMGGLGVKKISAAPAEGQSAADRTPPKKEDPDSVYLPSSTMMEADLLTGYAVETMQAGKSDPIKVVLRIKDLAILPNEVRVNTAGCFALAEGQGKLSDERVHFRLLKMSCIARDGTAVIDEDVTGQIIDMDGHVGLKGNVVTKAGALVGRAFIAGVFGGMGEGVSAGAWSVNTSSVGQTSVLNPGDVAQAGLGKGLEKGAGTLEKYFMDLANQAVPVIEGGAGRPVTIQIFAGVNLKIRDVCLDDSGCPDKGEQNDNDALSAIGTL